MKPMYLRGSKNNWAGKRQLHLQTRMHAHHVWRLSKPVSKDLP